jgi:hypothetical protein
MPEFKLEVPKIADRQLIRFFIEASKLVTTEEMTISQFGWPADTSLNLSPESVKASPLANSKGFSITRAWIKNGNVTLTVRRRGVSGFTPDELQIHNESTSYISNENVQKLNVVIDKYFVHTTDAFASVMPSAESLKTLLDSHQQMLARLEGVAAQVIERAAVAQMDMEKQFAERQANAEHELQKRAAVADESVHASRAAVIAREEELEARAKELDNRDHMFVRRQLRQDITKDIAERLRAAIVPPGTSYIGWLVLSLAISGSGFLGYISWTSLKEFAELAGPAFSIAVDATQASVQTSTAPLWALLGRGSLTGLASVLFLIYAISWLKSIYHDRVRAQRDLERYSIDLNRASWAVETILEANKVGGASLPDGLVASISRNLFGSGGEETDQSSDALATFLRASARAKFGPNGAEFEMNSRGTNKLAEKIES